MAVKVVSKYWLNKYQYIAEVLSDTLGSVLAIVTVNENGDIVRMVTYEKKEGDK